MAETFSEQATRALIRALSDAIQAKMTIKEASRRLGHETPKRLYNRLSGQTQIRLGEVLEMSKRLDLDLHEILVSVGLLAPALLDVPALLRHFSECRLPSDPEIRRFLAEPPQQESCNPSVSIHVPKRFLELEDLRAKEPARFQDSLSLWLQRSHARATLAGRPEALVEYVAALDLTATHLAHRGNPFDAANLLAHAMDLIPQEFVFSIYLYEHAANLLRELGQLTMAASVGHDAFTRATLEAGADLQARCLATLAAIYVLQGKSHDLQRAELAYRRIIDLAPNGRYALAAVINWAYLAVEASRPKEALDILSTLKNRLIAIPPTHNFYNLWISGRAHAALDDRQTAYGCFFAALGHHPEAQDPNNLLLVLECLYKLPNITLEDMHAAALLVEPHTRRIHRRSPTAALAARRLLTSLIEKRVSTSDVETLFLKIKSSR